MLFSIERDEEVQAERRIVQSWELINVSVIEQIYREKGTNIKENVKKKEHIAYKEAKDNTKRLRSVVDSQSNEKSIVRKHQKGEGNYFLAGSLAASSSSLASSRRISQTRRESLAFSFSSS